MNTQILDWHAHVYFDPASRDAALALRERIEKAFPIEMGRFHERPVGPHPRFSYQVAFKNEQFAPLLSWLTLNR
ncbi:MAG: DOPA 4,5-dioxygenase family protein, partial [Pseudomonadota bacterium]